MSVESYQKLIGENFDRFKRAREACVSNAGDLVNAARLLLDQGMDHISYHLATLALEEIGKITLLSVRFARETIGEREPFSETIIDDHIKKLFWAFWGPSFGRERLTKEQMAFFRGSATAIHKKRVGYLYVDPEQPVLPQDKMPAGEARIMVDLAEARLKLAQSAEYGEMDKITLDAVTWLVDSTEDPVGRGFIFSNESMDKLVELADGRKWITWLRDSFERLEAEGKDLTQRELNRESVS